MDNNINTGNRGAEEQNQFFLNSNIFGLEGIISFSTSKESERAERFSGPCKNASIYYCVGQIVVLLYKIKVSQSKD